MGFDDDEDNDDDHEEIGYETLDHKDTVAAVVPRKVYEATDLMADARRLPEPTFRPAQEPPVLPARQQSAGIKETVNFLPSPSSLPSPPQQQPPLPEPTEEVIKKFIGLDH